MDCTYEQMINYKKTWGWDKIEVMGNKTCFFWNEETVDSYEDVTSWFPTLRTQFSSIQFIYRKLRGSTKEDSKDRWMEELHVVMLQEDKWLSISATVRHTDKWVFPRLRGQELDKYFEEKFQSTFPAETFPQLKHALVEEILSLPQYTACIRNIDDNDVHQLTFKGWKDVLKDTLSTLMTAGTENENQLELIHVRKSTYRHYYTFCEEATNTLHKKGVVNTFIAHFRSIEDGKIREESFGMFLYHRNEFFRLDVTIQEHGNWKELKVAAGYASHGWEREGNYYEPDIDDMKQVFLDIVKEEPSVRLLVETGVLREEEN